MGYYSGAALLRLLQGAVKLDPAAGDQQTVHHAVMRSLSLSFKSIRSGFTSAVQAKEEWDLLLNPQDSGQLETWHPISTD